MAQNLQVFETGVGAKVEIVPLPKGISTYPKRITITVTDPVLKNGTSATITSTCATAGQTLQLPAGTVLPFLDPISGNTVIAQLAANATITMATGTGPYTGTGTFTLVANHPAIGDNSTSSNYIKLGSRSTASATATLQDETLRVFESALFSVGQIVGAEGEFACEGAFSSLDAGALTVRALTLGAVDIDGETVIQSAGGYVWVVVTTPSPSAAYSSGLVARGIAFCTDFSISLEAGAITKQALPFKLNGEIFYDDPVVA